MENECSHVLVCEINKYFWIDIPEVSNNGNYYCYD